MSTVNQTDGPMSRRGLVWRQAGALDAEPIADAIETWWARHLRHFVHPVFLEHFGDTCLVVEDDGRLVAFVVGMLSQRHADSAYVHFLGVHPDYRGLGLGRELYERFFFGDPVRMASAYYAWYNKEPFKERVNAFLGRGESA